MPGFAEANGASRPPFTVTGARAAALLAASPYAKRTNPGTGKLHVETLVCPTAAACASATTLEERRAHCDYVMRLYVYDPKPPAGGRGVFYLDIDDHVDATTGELWTTDGTAWSHEAQKP